MANKRTLKKHVNAMIYDAVEECFSAQLYDTSKKEMTDKFIDEIADFQDDILNKINAAKEKKEFKSIIEQIEKVNDDWAERLSGI